MSQARPYYHHFPAMGTRFDMVIPGSHPDPVAIGAQVEKLVVHWHGKLNRFDRDSDLSRINREASRGPLSLDQAWLEVFDLCETFVEKTDHFFDPAFLPVQQEWEKAAFGSVPKKLAEIKKQCGWEQVQLNREKGTVTFTNPMVGIDLGGFAKGFVLRKIGHMLESEGIDHAFISFGESSILARGHHPAGPHWPVAIRDLYSTENIYTFTLKSSALSVSGVTAGHMPHPETGYIHILDPQTGFPLRGKQLVAVESADPLEAEILSTALLVAGPEKSALILRQLDARDVIFVQWSGGKPEVTRLKPKNP